MIAFIDLFPQLVKNIQSYKLHLATEHNDDSPLNSFLQGGFKEWQERQTKKNFERDFIVSFISFDVDEWIFAGVYKSLGCKVVKDYYEYQTVLLDINTDLIGRLVIRFEKKFRQSYPYLENCLDNIGISQILKEKYSIVEFPGYERICLDFNYLQTVARKNDKTWFTALHNVKGVYLITDKTNGKHYVGSAYGEYALWSRLTQYAENGHGGNIELKKKIKEYGIQYAQNYQFTLLEVRMKKTDDVEIIESEQHWKKVLMSREYGYNKN
jgi:hypothetical protein